MKMLACSVFDDAVKAFNAPMWFRSKGEAIRAFTDAVNDSKTPFNAHAGDYGMFCLGSFDDQTGVLETNSQPEKLITGLECVVRE